VSFKFDIVLEVIGRQPVMSFLEIENRVFGHVSSAWMAIVFVLLRLPIQCCFSNRCMETSGWWAYRRYARGSETPFIGKRNNSVTTGRRPSYFRDNKNDNSDGELMRELHEDYCHRVDEEEDGDGSGSVLMTLPDIQLSDFRKSDSRRKRQHRNGRRSRI